VSTLSGRLTGFSATLDWLQRDALFVFTDETYIRAGGRPHKRHRITAISGEQPEERSSYRDPIYFSIMMWGAMCEDDKVERPMLLWEWETPEERQIHDRELNDENQQQRDEARERQVLAEVPETVQNRILNAANAVVDTENFQRPAGKRRRPYKRPDQIFTHKKLTRDQSKGIDWFLYRKYVLHERLFCW